MRKYTKASAQPLQQEDPAERLINKLTEMVERDTDRIIALVATTSRTLTLEEARTVSTYLKTVSDVRKSRKVAKEQELDLDQLMEEVSKVPGLREMLETKAGAWEQSAAAVNENTDDE